MRKTFLVASILLIAFGASALASSFRAADTVYLPAAGKLRGGNNSFFRTDVWISNLSQDNVTVEVAFAPGNAVDNRTVTASPVRITPAIPPGQRREIVDIFGSVFGVTDDQAVASARFGHLIFFGIRENGTNLNCEASNSDCRLISVEARIYTTAVEGSGIPAGATFGQLIPGIPWYSYISTDAQGVNLNTAFIAGIRVTTAYRTNIGLVNASQYSTTTVRVRLFNANGTQFGADFNQGLPPLAHIQLSVAAMFPGFSGSGAFATLEQVNVTPTNPSDPNFGSGLPGFLAYGSLLDNLSNDPTYLETQFTQSFADAQALCIYSGKATPPKRLARR